MRPSMEPFLASTSQPGCRHHAPLVAGSAPAHRATKKYGGEAAIGRVDRGGVLFLWSWRLARRPGPGLAQESQPVAVQDGRDGGLAVPPDGQEAAQLLQIR